MKRMVASLAALHLVNCTAPKGDGVDREVVPSREVVKPEPFDDKSSQGSDHGEVTPARSGVIDGNGGDYVTYQHNPYFFGGAVDYCIDMDPATVSITKEHFSRILADVIKEWVEVLATFKATFKEKHPDREFISLEYNEVSCSDKVPFRVLFGKFDSQIDRFLEVTGKDKIGAAVRTSYSEKTGQSTGFIWLAPDKGERRFTKARMAEFWRDDLILRSVLQHELGHVFGFVHDSMVVMLKEFPAGMANTELAAPVSFSPREILEREPEKWPSFCFHEFGSAQIGDPEVAGMIDPVDSEATYCLNRSDDNILNLVKKKDGTETSVLKLGAALFGNYDYFDLYVAEPPEQSGQEWPTISYLSYPKNVSVNTTASRGDQTIPITIKRHENGFIYTIQLFEQDLWKFYWALPDFMKAFPQLEDPE